MRNLLWSIPKWAAFSAAYWLGRKHEAMQRAAKIRQDKKDRRNRHTIDGPYNNYSGFDEFEEFEEFIKEHEQGKGE